MVTADLIVTLLHFEICHDIHPQSYFSFYTSSLNNVSHSSLYAEFYVTFITLSRMRWAGHVARVGRQGMHVGFWWKSQKER
jgi:hypothetical protein